MRYPGSAPLSVFGKKKKKDDFGVPRTQQFVRKRYCTLYMLQGVTFLAGRNLELQVLCTKVKAPSIPKPGNCTCTSTSTSTEYGVLVHYCTVESTVSSGTIWYCTYSTSTCTKDRFIAVILIVIDASLMKNPVFHVIRIVFLCRHHQKLLCTE